jgi:hypothetical protein
MSAHWAYERKGRKDVSAYSVYPTAKAEPTSSKLRQIACLRGSKIVSRLHAILQKTHILQCLSVLS